MEGELERIPYPHEENIIGKPYKPGHYQVLEDGNIFFRELTNHDRAEARLLSLKEMEILSGNMEEILKTG